MNALTIILIIVIVVLAFWLCAQKVLYSRVLKKIKESEAVVETKKGGNILRSLAISEKLSLSKLDGQATIAKAEDVFKSWIDPDFQNWGLSRKGKTTLETEVEVYEMVKNANFKDIFTSLSDDLNLLCLTQDQIIDFCKKHRGHLRQGGYTTFFLTKKDFEKPATEDNLFVVNVTLHSYGLLVLVYHFGLALVWSADARRRVVVSKLS